jgi:hypothetical protein
MNHLRAALLFLVWAVTQGSASHAAKPTPRLAELNAFWTEVSRAVRTGDFAAYRATCHPDGVLLSGTTMCMPLAQALAKWEPGFLDTQAGKLKADVQFRFSQRPGDATTAHETGIFCFTSVDAAGVRKATFVHFEALLVRKGSWQTLVENQKHTATQAEWDALAP